MSRKLMIQSLVASAVLGLALVFSAGSAAAQDQCDPQKEECPPPVCDPQKEECPEPPKCDPKVESCDLCHNIGGPNALGANCDAGNCDSILDTGNDQLISLYNEAVGACVNRGDCDPDNIYAGIVVPHSDNAIDAHARHGDGPTLVVFERIHDTQPHVSANLDCFAERVLVDPGN